jgi:gliding motility-associated-like protein
MRTIYFCLILQFFFISVAKSQRIILNRTICLGDTIRISPADFRCQDTQATVSWKLVQFLNLLTRNNKDKGVTFQGNQIGAFDALIKCNNETLAIRVTVKDCDIDIRCLGQNLVPNPSADTQGICKPERFSLTGFVAHWEDFPIYPFFNKGSSNYFNTECPQTPAIFRNIENFNVPRNGTGMMGIITGNSSNKILAETECVGVPLIKTLTVGRRYRVRFFIKNTLKYNGNNVDGLGAGFTIGDPDKTFSKTIIPTGPNSSTYDITYIGDSAKVRSPTKQFIRDTIFWTKVEGIFRADKPYTHLLVGDLGGMSVEFNDFKLPSPLTGTYYLLDDFSVQEVVNVFETASADTVVCTNSPARIQFKYPLDSVALKNLTTNETKLVSNFTTLEVPRVSQTVCFEGSSLFCDDTFKVCFRPIPPFDTLIMRQSCLPQDTGLVIKRLGCDSVMSIKTELRSPLKIELNTDTIVDEGSRFQLNPVVVGDSIKSSTWSPPLNLSCSNCLNPVIIANKSNNYELTIVSQSNCVSQAQQRIAVRKAPYVFVPNVFSPNGDGQNDRLIVFANPNRVKQIRRFALFNRWGNLVFEKLNFAPNDESSSWDGIINGKSVSNDVFTYFVEVVLFDDQIKIVAGDVTLVN